MGSRSDWLTDFAKPVADEMAARAGSLKHVLSAGIMALHGCTPDEREVYMAKAVGKKVEIDPEEQRIRKVVIQILDETQAVGRKKSVGPKARTSKGG